MSRPLTTVELLQQRQFFRSESTTFSHKRNHSSWKPENVNNIATVSYPLQDTSTNIYPRKLQNARTRGAWSQENGEEAEQRVENYTPTTSVDGLQRPPQLITKCGLVCFQ